MSAGGARRLKARRVRCFLLALLAFGLGAPFSWAQCSSSDLAALQAQVTVLQTQVAALQAVAASDAFDPVVAGGVFAFFFLGAAGVWFFAKNLGLILQAVKDW